METIRIRHLLGNGQFTICGRHRIIRCLGIKHDGETVTMWDSESGTLPPERLMDHEITAIDVTDNTLEIEYDGDEYLAIEDMEIRNIWDLAEYLNTTPGYLKRDVYDATECGAWIEWDDTTVKVGSVVEGSDAEYDRSFSFPFYASEYDTWIDELEQLTDAAWKEANGAPNEEE